MHNSFPRTRPVTVLRPW